MKDLKKIIKMTLKGIEVEKALTRLKLLKKYLNCKNNGLANLVRNYMTEELKNRPLKNSLVIKNLSKSLKVNLFLEI